jgi:hypothetical protein
MSASGLRLKPVAVSPEVQRAQLLAGLANKVAFADQDLVGVPAERFALRAVAPARDRAPRAARSEREILEAQDFGDGRAGVSRAHRSRPERTGDSSVAHSHSNGHEQIIGWRSTGYCATVGGREIADPRSACAILRPAASASAVRARWLRSKQMRAYYSG